MYNLKYSESVKMTKQSCVIVTYSKQESLIIEQLKKGYRIVDMVNKIGMHNKTISHHLRSIREKSGIDSTEELRQHFLKSSYRLTYKINLDEEIKIFNEACKRGVKKPLRGNASQNVIRRVADIFGVSRWAVEETIRKYLDKKYTVIIDTPTEECYTLSFGKIINV